MQDYFLYVSMWCETLISTFSKRITLLYYCTVGIMRNDIARLRINTKHLVSKHDTIF